MPTVVREEKDEMDALLAFLEAQRGAVKRAALGLTDEQAGAAPTAGALCVGGLIKHLTRVEVNWIQVVLAGGTDPKAVSSDQWGELFRMAPGETVASLVAEWDEVARETEETVRALPGLDVTVPLPEAPWNPPGARRSARWILLHMIEEVARHAGHADIVRESIDGATAFELVARAREEAAS
jgi:uncharacterized damage-inducible protein DinB